MTYAFSSRSLKLCFAAAAFALLPQAHSLDLKQQTAACAACHPTRDIPRDSTIPIIWGQNVGYLYVQLLDFKSGARAAPIDAAMHALTEPMSDADMLAIAKYVSAQSWPNLATTAPTGALDQRGALVAALGDCGACHFDNWQGYGATPRLRGRTPPYLAPTIPHFRTGEPARAPGRAHPLPLRDAGAPRGLRPQLAYVG